MNGKIVGEMPKWFSQSSWTTGKTINFTIPKSPKFVLINLRIVESDHERVYSGWSDSFYKISLSLGNYTLDLSATSSTAGTTLVFTGSITNFGLDLIALVG